ncbi:MAG: NAD(P)-dependent oxidoreductase [Holophagaceae bacterium]|nr:NAD(P)-dependent oxidoreductase [Holophagaceae bacterium]
MCASHSCLGNMGLPMARNLLGREHTVTVFNRTPGRAEALAALGAKVATTVAEAVGGAEVAITMLSDDSALNEVAQGQDGLLRHLPARGIHICMGSLGIEVSAALATSHAHADQGYVAAPVFGRPESAATRHLWILAGGPSPR